ncbi:MAG TPA: protein-disulfide reductase DsbD domain-containing protein [Pseudolabrys sp.]|nr:protein-disulfide reductase DsbD domain-containing protein [Pseudolabrys sp.]
MNGLHKLLHVALAACGVVLLGAPAHAADASPWSQDSRSGLRLVAGANRQSEAPLRAGIEIKLQPGWKTYWRYPGDSGVPPRFDFSGSDNLKSATVLYPAPHLFADEIGRSLGYKDAVMFPLLISPAQPGKPVTLRLKLDYAVCEKLCIPAEGRAELTLGAGDSSHDATLAAAEARVPKPVAAAAAGLSVRRINDAPKPLITVDLNAPADKPVELFVEGPTPEWALPIPRPAQGAPAGRRHFSFELDGLPPGVDPKGRVELTFTVVEGERAIEVKTYLD